MVLYNPKKTQDLIALSLSPLFLKGKMNKHIESKREKRNETDCFSLSYTNYMMRKQDTPQRQKREKKQV